jgi:hypothetical protein
MEDPVSIITEVMKKIGSSYEDRREIQLLENTSLQDRELEEFYQALDLKSYMKKHAKVLEKILPSEVRLLLAKKYNIKPYQFSVVKFREIMTKNCAPLEKLFMIHELKQYIF